MCQLYTAAQQDGQGHENKQILVDIYKRHCKENVEKLPIVTNLMPAFSRGPMENSSLIGAMGDPSTDYLLINLLCPNGRMSISCPWT